MVSSLRSAWVLHWKGTRASRSLTCTMETYTSVANPRGPLVPRPPSLLGSEEGTRSAVLGQCRQGNFSFVTEVLFVSGCHTNRKINGFIDSYVGQAADECSTVSCTLGGWLIKTRQSGLVHSTRSLAWQHGGLLFCTVAGLHEQLQTELMSSRFVISRCRFMTASEQVSMDEAAENSDLFYFSWSAVTLWI